MVDRKQMIDNPYKAPQHQAIQNPWTRRTKSAFVACLILAGATAFTWYLTGDIDLGSADVGNVRSVTPGWQADR